jgi:ADP-heptose:LPS heptosyltransferase
MMLHLAGALNKKIVALFGSMPPSCRINHYPNAVAVVNQNISCLGCVYAQCNQAYYCMSSLLAEPVLFAVEEKLRADYVSSTSSVEGDVVLSRSPMKRRISSFTI